MPFMNPNLFRSISNSLAEQFPLLPRIRRSFIGLLMFCCIFLWIGLSGENITVSVEPIETSPYSHHQIVAYTSGKVQLSGQLTIQHTTLLERLLLSDAKDKFDFFTMLFLAMGSVIIILIIPKLHQQNLFRKDISHSIRLLGYLLMLHGCLSIYRALIYIPEKIELLTHHEFTGYRSFPIIVFAELYFSLIILALAGMYQRGIKLQEELDLTV